MRLSHILYLTFIFVVVTFLAHSSYTQTISPNVNGIRLQASYNSIIKKLGKPVSDRRRGEVPCGQTVRTLSYDGLTLRLEVSGPQPFGLYKVEVDSRRWRVSGVRIGDNKAKVIRRFGRVDEFKENGKHYFRYWITDGWANFYFNRNRLTKVEWEFSFC